MSGKELSEALGGISDEKVERAAVAYRRKSKRRTLLFRAAAVAATLAILLTVALWPRPAEDGTIITAPGILKVYAYDLTSGMEVSQLESMELEQGVEMPYEYGWSVTTNIVPGLPITLSLPEDTFPGAEITFEITVSGGEFFRTLGGEYGLYRFGPAYLGQNFVLENNQTIYWWNNITDMENWEEEYDEERIREALGASAKGETSDYTLPTVVPFYAGKAYMNIIIRADAHIVGYMTILIYAEDTSLLMGSKEYAGSRYYAKLIKSVCYPLVDGKYQEVSREMVGI